VGRLVLIDIGAELAAQLAESRADAESLMLDSCTIGVLGDPVTDPVTDKVTTPLEPLYTGRCKVQTYEAQESNPEAGGATFTVQRYTVHIPVGAYAPQVGHVVEIGAAALDPHLVGRRYRVAALMHKTLATAYRLGVEEVPDGG
jgi:hypothetical protein